MQDVCKLALPVSCQRCTVPVHEVGEIDAAFRRIETARRGQIHDTDIPRRDQSGYLHHQGGDVRSQEPVCELDGLFLGLVTVSTRYEGLAMMPVLSMHPTHTNAPVGWSIPRTM